MLPTQMSKIAIPVFDCRVLIVWSDRYQDNDDDVHDGRDNYTRGLKADPETDLLKLGNQFP